MRAAIAAVDAFEGLKDRFVERDLLDEYVQARIGDFLGNRARELGLVTAIPVAERTGVGVRVGDFEVAAGFPSCG